MSDRLPILPVALLLALGPIASSHATPHRTGPDPCLQDKICRGHVDTARTMSGAGLHAEALKEYEAAYARRPTPWLVFNLARLLERMNRSADALPLYQRYLDEMGNEDSEQVRTARAALADAQTRRTSAAAPPPSKPPIATPPPAPIVQPPPPPIVAPVETAKSAPGISGPLVAGFLIGSGLGLLGAGLGFGQNAKEVESILVSNLGPYDQRLFDHGASLNRLAIGLDVTGSIIAAAGVVVTIVLVARRDKVTSTSRARLHLGTQLVSAGGF